MEINSEESKLKVNFAAADLRKAHSVEISTTEGGFSKAPQREDRNNREVNKVWDSAKRGILWNMAFEFGGEGNLK